MRDTGQRQQGRGVRRVAHAVSGWRVVVAGLALAVSPAAGLAQGPPFYPDDPILADTDLLDVTTEPAELELSDLFDRLGHIFADVGEGGGEAQNVNTLDEVPDGNWFVNRQGLRRLTLEELTRGPNTTDGPNPNAPWRVFRSKSQGLTPGFQIIDDVGDRYIIKFDPVEVPELASAAEVIATKLFYAIGYHTPQNHIVRVRPDNFVIEAGTTLEDQFGDERELTAERLARVLRGVPRLADGRLRVTASKYLDGQPLGPFRYHGTRSDDPNDVIPHEHRRELRGLRLFAAWTNHDDTRAQNTQDSWVDVDGRRHIRHHLLDFGSTFGSGSVEIQLANLSFQYWLDMAEVKRNVLGLGLRAPAYRSVEWPQFPKYQSVGRWESVAFDPVAWKNDYPNPAFVRMTDRDAFWAAKILMRFTAEELLAIVQTGEYSDPDAERYFHQVLVERQQKSGRYAMGRINPVDEFALTGAGLEFVNLAERYGFAASGTRYQTSWSIYVNGADGVLGLSEPATGTSTVLSLPADPPLGGDSYLMAEIRSLHPDFPAWDTPVRVYLRPDGDRFELVGIER
ncbi:MAG: hypothetical protein O3A25_03285 [Acidobacteria bacterium]|nr:hypothetical protein [Acidobacteriota bacterium]